MAKNATQSYVHVHAPAEEGGATTVVGPGEDFPDFFKPTKDLTNEPDDYNDGEVPGPGQFSVSVSPADQVSEWRNWKVPELRAKLGRGNYEEGDRKDVLVEKAIQAGVDPTGPRS